MDVFTAIAHPLRRELLERLAVGEQPASRLAEPFSVSRPAISQHLDVLVDAGLVSERKEGRERLFKLNPTPLREVSEWVGQMTRYGAV
jgi:DNA-binding transcriptional ArsR family regulator